MPEGHTVHRIAKRFEKDFQDKKLKVLSPQGRFTDAALVTGKKLTSAQASNHLRQSPGDRLGQDFFPPIALPI